MFEDEWLFESYNAAGQKIVCGGLYEDQHFPVIHTDNLSKLIDENIKTEEEISNDDTKIN